MFSGRHLVCIGALACAGLASVRSSQDQVKLGYELATYETKLRKVRNALINERAELQKLHSPGNILHQSSALNPDLGPQSKLALYRQREETEHENAEVNHQYQQPVLTSRNQQR